MRKNVFKVSILVFVALSVLVSSVCFGMFSSYAKEDVVMKTVKNAIKGKVKNISSDDMIDLIKRQYMRTHLMDENGQWVFKELQNIDSDLIPYNLSNEDVLNFIDEIAANLQDNKYFMDFFKQLEGKEFKVLKAKFEEEGDREIPKIVAWAIALENLTKAELNDPSLIGLISEFWISERKRLNINFSYMGLFGTVKLASVEGPIKKMVEFHKTGELDPKFLKFMLPLNIYEAVTADRVMGYYDNAEAGVPLYKNVPGEPENPILGTGDATFSKDGKKIELRMALPKKWADLYQVWNMAFVTQIDSYPYWIVKLLIPQVSDYKDYPEEYIYRRALALYSSEHYMFLGGKDDEKQGIKWINWADKDLTKFFGKVNKESAADYTKDVEEARKRSKN